MFDGILTKIFGSRNNRLVKAYRRRVAQINKLEPELKKLTDDQLKAKTQEFRDRLQKGETLDAYLENRVFAGQKGVTLAPDPADVAGFEAFAKRYVDGLPVVRKAVECVKA